MNRTQTKETLDRPQRLPEPAEITDEGLENHSNGIEEIVVNSKVDELRPIELCGFPYALDKIDRFSKQDSAVGHPNFETSPECRTKKIYFDVPAGTEVVSPVKGPAAILSIRDERDGMPSWGQHIVMMRLR